MKSKFQHSSTGKIILPDWQKTHPPGMLCASDLYYMQLSNKILTVLSTNKGESLFTPQLKRAISVRIAAYFEDVISGFGLWKAFISIHQKMYGKYLPFLNIITDEYYDDEINCADVQFLIWAYIQQDFIDTNDNRFINPENPYLAILASELYELLDSEYETAPANDDLFYFIHQTDFKNDIISSRNLLDWLHYDSYLSMSYPRLSLMEELKGLKKGESKTFFEQNSEILSYAMEKIGIFSKSCSPIAIKANEWAAQIFTGTPNATLFASMKFTQIANYNLVGLDTETFTLVDVGNKKYSVTVDSVSSPEVLPDSKSVMCSLLYFNGLWHINGFASFMQEQIDLKKMPSEDETTESNNYVYSHVLKVFKEEISYYDTSNNLKKALLSLFPTSDKNKLIPPDFNQLSNFVLFVHPETGLSIFPEIAAYLSDSRNPYYSIDAVEQKGIGMLTGYYKLPKELLEYLIDRQFLKDISLNSLHGKEYGKKLLQENIRFIVRFFQPHLYNQKVFVG